MRVSFSTFGQYTIATGDISESEVLGSGGSLSPQLSILLRLNVQHGAMRPRDGIEVLSLSGTLSAGGNTFSLAPLKPIGFIIEAGYDGFTDQIQYLDFPLNTARIVALEALRAGGEMKLRLDAELAVNKIRALNDRPPNAPLTEVVWGHVKRCPLYLKVDLTIPRDVWISRVLPNVGYGKVHVLEFPAAPLEACARLNHAFQALQQAQEFHKIGRYDDAVGKCRVALDPFFEYVDKVEPEDGTGKTVVRRVPILKKSFEAELGAATFVWLDQTLGTIKGAANRTHHSPNAHYSQLDSQMILSITTAVVAYAARSIDLNELK